jgi:8-oxo-dGTP diphosphatase
VEAQWRRAAAYVVCRDRDGRLLLTRVSHSARADVGKWTMPGGGMEWGERPEETALRELVEETGLRARIGPVLGVYSYWFDEHESVRRVPGHVLGLVFEGTNLDGELQTAFDEGTTDAAAWFTLAEIRALPRVSLVDFVIDLLEQ